MRLLFAILTFSFLAVPALATIKPNKNMDLCKHATYAAEKKFNIPSNLLRAISLTESGRWVKEDKANISWPWTVTSGGSGQYFPSKQAAIKHVMDLKSQGVRNIDVGCMQINLRYHPNAFKDMNQAFDPYQNANYAGDFLSRLFKETKSWSAAAGRYHSSEPTKNMYYREKVLAFWNYANQQGVQPYQSNPKSYKVARIDQKRTTMLNNNFQKRLNQQRQAMNKAEKMSAQISQYRNSRRLSQYSYSPLDAAKNRARKAQKRKKLLTVPEVTTRNYKNHDFSANRSAQLDKWRRTVANPDLFKSSQTTKPTTLLTK
jgi:hypothetical protein